MERETQHTLRPRPPRRAKKRQIVQSSPETGEQVADIIRVAAPAVRKPTKPTKPPERNSLQTQLQPLFLSAKERFDFSPPARGEPLPFTFLPWYPKIIAPEPLAELDTQASLHYKIIHHECALLGHTIKEIDEGPESPEGEREKHELVKAIDQLSRIINKQECGMADDASLVNALELPTSNDPKLENLKTAIETRIDQLDLKINELLSRNSTETKKHASYASIAPGASSAPSAPYRPEVPLEKHQVIDHTTRLVVEVSQPVPTAFNPLDLREAINQSLPTTCPARVVAIRRSRWGNLIFSASDDPAHLVSVSESWLYCLPFGEARINNENQWKRKILYLSFPCESSDILNEELQTSNPTLYLAAPAGLLTPTVALLYFGNSIYVPEHLYIFATYNWLQEYRTLTLEERKAAQRKKSERRKDSPSYDRRTEQVEKEKENLGGEGKMDVGWASEMEEDTTSTSPQG